MRPAQPLAAAEDGDVRAQLAREVPEAADRRDLRRRIHEHRHAVLVRDGDDLRQRQRATGVVRPREPEDAGGARRNRRFQFPRVGGVRPADLDERRARLPRGVVVAVAVRAVDDHLALAVRQIGEAGDRRRVVPRDAGRDRDGDPRRRAAGNVACLVVRQRRDALADALLQEAADPHASPRPPPSPRRPAAASPIRRAGSASPPH